MPPPATRRSGRRRAAGVACAEAIALRPRRGPPGWTTESTTAASATSAFERPDASSPASRRETARALAAAFERDDARLRHRPSRAPRRSPSLPADEPDDHAPGRIRTSDPRIRSPPLCPLSYGRPGGSVDVWSVSSSPAARAAAQPADERVGERDGRPEVDAQRSSLLDERDRGCGARRAPDERRAEPRERLPHRSGTCDEVDRGGERGHGRRDRQAGREGELRERR